MRKLFKGEKLFNGGNYMRKYGIHNEGLGFLRLADIIVNFD